MTCRFPRASQRVLWILKCFVLILFCTMRPPAQTLSVTTGNSKQQSRAHEGVVCKLSGARGRSPKLRQHGMPGPRCLATWRSPPEQLLAATGSAMSFGNGAWRGRRSWQPGCTSHTRSLHGALARVGRAAGGSPYSECGHAMSPRHLHKTS